MKEYIEVIKKEATENLEKAVAILDKMVELEEQLKELGFDFKIQVI